MTDAAISEQSLTGAQHELNIQIMMLVNQSQSRTVTSSTMRLDAEISARHAVACECNCQLE
jgi:hypothetical protein